MNKSRVHYITGYVNVADLKFYRTSPSGNDKSEYIKDVLLELDVNLSIISALEVNSIKPVFLSKKNLSNDKYIHIYLSAFGGTGNVFIKLISRAWCYFSLFFYCLYNISSDDIVLFYHSTSMMYFVKLFSRFIKGKIIFEVEELYGALSDNDRLIEKEKHFLNKYGHGYVFVNDIMALDFVLSDKPYSTCYGKYKQQLEISNNKPTSAEKLICYAGLIDDKKYKDAFEAVDLARFFPDNYIVSIIGYGTNEAINKLLLLINQVNTSADKIKVRYDGCLLGKDLQEYFSKISYGLCLRDTKDKYMQYTFPSKVFVYMNNGIIPICTKISPIINSTIVQNVILVDKCDMKLIVSQILEQEGKVTLPNLDKMHEEFVFSLKETIYRL